MAYYLISIRGSFTIIWALKIAGILSSETLVFSPHAIITQESTVDIFTAVRTSKLVPGFVMIIGLITDHHSIV
jgi:hypothetical protein